MDFLLDAAMPLPRFGADKPSFVEKVSVWGVVGGGDLKISSNIVIK